MGIYLVIKNNFKRSYNNRILFILMLLLPVILTVLGGFANQISSNEIRIGILPGNHTQYYKEVTGILDTSKGVRYAKADAASIKTDLIMGKYHIAVDFREAEDVTGFKLIDYHGYATGEVGDKLKASFETKTPFTMNGQSEKSAAPAGRMTAFLMTLLMITATLNSSLLIRDRREGTLTRFCYSPYKLSVYTAGILLFNLIITMLQIICSYLFMKLSGLPFGITAGSFPVICILLSLSAASFGTFITAVSKSDMKANITASGAATFLSIIGGAFVPYENMPGILKAVSIISPIRWMMEISSSLEQGISAWNNAVPYAVLTGFIFILYLLSILFKRVR